MKNANAQFKPSARETLTTFGAEFVDTVDLMFIFVVFVILLVKSIVSLMSF